MFSFATGVEIITTRLILLKCEGAWRKWRFWSGGYFSLFSISSQFHGFIYFLLSGGACKSLASCPSGISLEPALCLGMSTLKCRAFTPPLCNDIFEFNVKHRVIYSIHFDKAIKKEAVSTGAQVPQPAQDLFSAPLFSSLKPLKCPENRQTRKGHHSSLLSFFTADRNLITATAGFITLLQQTLLLPLNKNSVTETDIGWMEPKDLNSAVKRVGQ